MPDPIQGQSQVLPSCLSPSKSLCASPSAPGPAPRSPNTWLPPPPLPVGGEGWGREGQEGQGQRAGRPMMVPPAGWLGSWSIAMFSFSFLYFFKIIVEVQHCVSLGCTA